MIDVAVLQAKENLFIGKNATFLYGELYFGRKSKDGSGYVIRSEEGYWIPVFSNKLTINRFKYREWFNVKATVYMRSRRRLNDFVSATHYINGDNVRKWYYPFQYIDVELL